MLWILIFMNFCNFWRLKFTKLSEFRASKMAKTTVLELLGSQNWFHVKSEWQKNPEIFNLWVNFHTVNIWFSPYSQHSYWSFWSWSTGKGKIWNFPPFFELFAFISSLFTIRSIRSTIQRQTTFSLENVANTKVIFSHFFVKKKKTIFCPLPDSNPRPAD